MDLSSTPFLRACRMQPADHTPVWFMRQAGRYMADYRALRKQYSILEIIASPELSMQVTLQPIDAFRMDAAIIFADILVPLVGMGLQLEFVAGDGPSIANPIRTAADVDRLATPPATESMAPTLRAIELTSKELTPRGVPLIGFAGAPFTLACYAIEGRGSPRFDSAKAFMYQEPAAWRRLMRKLTTMVSDLLIAQAKAGASAIQVFDSWAGILGPDDYADYVQPHMKTLFASLAAANVPVISFSTGTSGILEQVAESGGDVIGVDWRIPLDTAWQRIGNRAIMGNLDPVVLCGPWRELQARIDTILQRANGKPGHIFNLGHGVLPHTPIENVRRVIEYVHEKTSSVVTV